jgi:hypothetical protein
MVNDIKDLEPGDLAWFALNEDDLPQMVEIDDVTPGQVAVQWDGGILVADASKVFLLEKWWGHGPLGDGTGMGPDGFDPDWASKEEKSNDIKGLEKEK